MSKLRCHCGNVISDSDQRDSEKYWGEVVTCGDKNEAVEVLAKSIAGLCIAYEEGLHVQWLKDNCPVYSDQPLEAIISDMITRLNLDLGTVYARCSKCGTLMIQKNSFTNEFVPYRPATEDRCEEI